MTSDDDGEIEDGKFSVEDFSNDKLRNSYEDKNIKLFSLSEIQEEAHSLEFEADQHKNSDNLKSVKKSEKNNILKTELFMSITSYGSHSTINTMDKNSKIFGFLYSKIDPKFNKKNKTLFIIVFFLILTINISFLVHIQPMREKLHL